MSRELKGWRTFSPPFLLTIVLLAAIVLVLQFSRPNSIERNLIEQKSDYYLLLVSASEEKSLMIPVQAGEEFTLRYIHSVDLLPVYELFKISEGELLLLEMRGNIFGAGLGECQGDLALEDDMQAVKNINLSLPELLLRIGTIAEHTLIFKDKEFFLAEEFTPGELVIISVDKKRDRR